MTPLLSRTDLYILTVLIDFENKASDLLIDFPMATFRQIVTNRIFCLHSKKKLLKKLKAVS